MHPDTYLELFHIEEAERQRARERRHPPSRGPSARRRRQRLRRAFRVSRRAAGPWPAWLRRPLALASRGRGVEVRRS
jgi:hypothetical protein